MEKLNLEIRRQVETEYWHALFADINSTATVERIDKTVSNGSRENITLKVRDEIAQKLSQVSENMRPAKFLLMLAALKITYFKYAPDANIIASSSLGLGTSDKLARPSMIWFRNQINANLPVISFLEDLRKTLLCINGFSLVSLSDMQARVTELNPASVPLLSKMAFYYDGFNQHISDFDKCEFVLAVQEKDGETFIHADFVPALGVEYANQFVGHVLATLSQLLIKPRELALSLSMCSEAESNEILYRFNSPILDGPCEMNIARMFEEKVQENPDSIAVVCGTEKLSYRQLNENANSVAHYLCDTFDVRADTIIGVHLTNSPLLPIALLGIIKSGASYLPFPVDCPEERFNYIVEDSMISILITNCEVFLDKKIGSLVVLDFPSLLPTLRMDVGNLDKSIRPEDLGYVIYTSGSTGRPKGVLIQHKSLCNYIGWFQATFKIKCSDSTLLFSSTAFDLSYTSLWGSLLSGACLYIFKDSEELDLNMLLNTLTELPVTFLKLTPSHLNLLVNASGFETVVRDFSLRLIVIGGEKIRSEDISKYLAHDNACEMVNHYGPTETTVGTIYTKIETQAVNNRLTLIGRPITNSQVLILDDFGNLVPKGIPGEICVTGVGLARGYLNNPELTAEKFRKNQYDANGSCMYLTGDVGMWTNDGQIEFHGRKDGQVKIRGYRVEISEIENTLRTCSWVKDAAVIAKYSKGNVELIACVATEAKGNEVTASDLNRIIESALPSYMRPSYIHYLTDLPLTPNGKIDKKRLADVVPLKNHDCKAPRTELESQLVNIWAKFLGNDDVGIDLNFYEAGGNSLIALQIINNIHRLTGINIGLKIFLQNSTIEKLAKEIELITWLRPSQNMPDVNENPKRIVI